MAITNGYTTQALLKQELGQTDTLDNAALDNVIEATSRAIDNICSRLRGCPTRFYTTSSDESRYYTAQFEDRVVIDDLLSITTLKTDAANDGTYETTIASTAYFLEPKNNALGSLPYTHLVTREGTDFPLIHRAVEVTGKFGFSLTASPPDYITGACLLASMRLFMRRSHIYGQAGTPALGVTQVEGELLKDPEIMALLEFIPQRPKGLQVHYG